MINKKSDLLRADLRLLRLRGKVFIPIKYIEKGIKMLKKGDIIKILKAEKICMNTDIDSFRNLCIKESISNFEEYIEKIEWNKTPDDNTYCRIIDIVDDIGVLQTFMTRQVYVVKLYEKIPVLKQKSK